MLEELVKQQPADAELASRLAVVCELQGELPRCEQVLTPHEKYLGEQEGARILGRIYVNQGKYEAAYALLQPYTAARLPKLRAAEQAFEHTLKSLQDRVVTDLRGGKASGFDYNRYKSANQATQQALRPSPTCSARAARSPSSSAGNSNSPARKPRRCPF